RSQNNSGQDGLAILADEGDGTVRVSLDLRNSPAGPQPAHIHDGTCANLNPSPRFPLTNVVNGRSETSVRADYATLTSGTFAVNVHRSAQEANIYTSCGNLPVRVAMQALNNSGQEGTAALMDLGDGRVRVSVDLQDSPAGPQPAHLHEGSCANLNAAPRFPLENVANGRSDSTVQADYTQLMTRPFALNVHRSAQEANIYTSCGNLPGTVAAAATQPAPAISPTQSSAAPSPATKEAGTTPEPTTGGAAASPSPAVSPSPAR
ncbi:MAG TPA: hypothetical protein VHL09_02785, partial [Dehalococcoidia bacterium]|nr:hypothetical protein [Dehalococcoidia bacterium]